MTQYKLKGFHPLPCPYSNDTNDLENLSGDKIRVYTTSRGDICHYSTQDLMEIYHIAECSFLSACEQGKIQPLVIEEEEGSISTVTGEEFQRIANATIGRFIRLPFRFDPGSVAHAISIEMIG